MDLFFLRRFLDKDYVTNGIVYTGALHSSTYVYTLIKYFGFKITHWSYLKVTPEELYKLVEKMNNPDDISEYIYPPKLYQCSDMTKFPKLFT